MIITAIINNFYKQTTKGNNYRQIHSDALYYPQEREAIIMDIEDALYEMMPESLKHYWWPAPAVSD